MRLLLPFSNAWRPLASGLAARVADRYGLVLSAARIPHRLRRDSLAPRTWEILVPESRLDRAQDEIDRYLAENPDAFAPPTRSASAANPWRPLAGGGLPVALALLIAHLVLSEPALRGLADAGVAWAQAVLAGEPWRALTALFLHADAAHLAANMAGLVLFGGLAAQEAGWGLGWLLILLVGTAGNLVNAWFHGVAAGVLGLPGNGLAHRSIGASTAVFGAVGLLGGCRLLSRSGARLGVFGQVKAMAPLGAALALLTLLGMGNDEEGVRDVNVDILAHVFGWLAGLGCGLWLGLARRAAPSRSRQTPWALLALALVGLAWGLAWRGAYLK